MIKLFLFSMILPILSGSTAGQGNVRDFYPKEIIYQESSASNLPKVVQTAVNKSFQMKNCNPSALYKIQKETTYPIADLKGQTTFVYSVDFRVFGEADQKSFNGYEGAKKFRNRTVTLRQSENGISIAHLNCEVLTAKK